MKHKPLHNIYSKDILRKKIESESFERTTISFYKYVIIQEPLILRNELYREWEELGVLGRIYLAKEGINAQLSVPEFNYQKFRDSVDSKKEFKNVPFKIAVEQNGHSFLKLDIRVRNKIVADGLADESFDVTNVGTHLNAEEFNLKLESSETILVDVRNHYESEIGHFEGAILPQSDTFREELPLILDMLQDKKDKEIVMYCTGGIRCEKASAYLKHHGFQNVFQLHGGIISYASEIKEKGLESKFKGKNFVFDGRLQETIGEEILSECHQCGERSARHINCANPACHILFIQCESCAEKFQDCCSVECQEIAALPVSEQKKLRKGKAASNQHFSKARIRPKVFELYRDK
ncbi:rhodanese-related sulfurtransferase [Leptospira sarikeiensis]|uniref:tRNA uridine(34) hydroxylase n=1 Tax=Leptospira sarikeiensis TaxID=2484943 RepID=A0A4R9KCL6_9LEPT|nr:rhodanese-related sulfurtransferase [Leptospira sarikeiensis]TGL64669.1 rhodanese-related sulfurtransferase [Leptospira sarikeiensis]